MKETGDAFLKRLLATFRVEAEEHIRALSSGLIELEQAEDAGRRQELLEAVFREAHSLKGAARAVEQGEMERLCQAGEGVLASLKAGRVALSQGLLDVLHASVDELDRLLGMLDGAPPAERSVVTGLCRRLDAVAGGRGGVPSGAPQRPRAQAGGTAQRESPVTPPDTGGARPAPATGSDAPAAATPQASGGPAEPRAPAGPASAPEPRPAPQPPAEPAPSPAPMSGAEPEAPPASEPATDEPESSPAPVPPSPEPPTPRPDPGPPPEQPATVAVAEAAPSIAVERHPVAEGSATIRIQAGRLDAVLYQAEAMVGARLAMRARLGEIAEARAVFMGQQRERARLAPDIRMLQRRLQPPRQGQPGAGEAMRDSGAMAAQLRRLVTYLGEEEAFFKSFEARLAALERTTSLGVRALASQVDGLLDDLKQALMLPVSSGFEGLAKLVRDLSREQGKEVGFVTRGGELEIDRRVLEEIRDPIIHLVRNAIDHGIEPPDERSRRGKARRASLTVTARGVEGSRVEIRIADDGAGVDLAKLRASARQLGLEADAAAADEARLFALMFESGVTTSPLVTDISGRGLGLAIVREKVERLGGTVTVASRPGQGTTFGLVLPLSLATFRGVRVRAAGEEFIFPSMGLERVLRLRRGEIGTMENREMFRLAGQAVALARLADVLGLPTRPAPPAEIVTAVVCGTGERRMAFQVDEIVGEQEVLVKSLGRQLRRVPNIAGATVLGSGQVVPVLYLPDLLKSARRAPAEQPRSVPRPAQRKSILIAEDSITSRILLKGILESAGYQVTTAVDGADALARLQGGRFDLLVSDVDMPRMSGFDLTAKVRADPRLAELPVVLVTSLDSRQDRERGADVGANAYLVKSGFDRTNLLATIRRLL